MARIPGPQGEKGEKGEPGFGFTDMSYDGERRLTFKRFDEQKVFVMPILIDRGVWKLDKAYERGDCITSDGGLWIAQVDSQGEKPGISKGWRLAVKRGRDNACPSLRCSVQPTCYMT